VAELRSFIIGVTIAAVVLGIAAVAFGAFDGGDGGSPSVTVLGTATPARTAVASPTRSGTSPAGTTGTPALTQAPVNTVAPTATRTQVPIATATATRVAQPTTPPATPTPAGTSVALYKQRLSDLSAQTNYALGQANSPNPDDAGWKQNSIAAAQNIQALASAINSAPPPSCAAGVHSTVSSGATQASSGAGLLISGAYSGDSTQISQAAGTLGSALQAIYAGISGVNSSC
jgi:hypothetical protein